MSSTAILRRLVKKVAPIPKRTYACDKLHHPSPGWVGSNLPFQIENVPRFMFVTTIYMVTGFYAPFIAFHKALIS
ncbi:hypothetical protein RUM43_002948 [Polyplax serrata]|uniref:Cytochrome c oxidase polypeptide VIIc n=1 Tax=Polyplax serrata TaxID=468196 RepID=A0AAN8P0M8_POLSC